METAKIYKIHADTPDSEIYVGSTTQTLEKRLQGHLSNYRKWKKDPTKGGVSSYSLFEKYGIDNVKISLVESYPCHSKTELLFRETYWMSEIPCINKRVSYIDRAGYLAYQREYYIKNKERRLAYMAQQRLHPANTGRKDTVKQRTRDQYLAYQRDHRLARKIDIENSLF